VAAAWGVFAVANSPILRTVVHRLFRLAVAQFIAQKIGTVDQSFHAVGSRA